MNAITVVRPMSKEVKALANIMDKPNLVGLSYALRHPETWPKDFVWNYKNCKSCAIGLAARLWALSVPAARGSLTRLYMTENSQNEIESYMARTMAMSHRASRKIFFHVGDKLSAVTADDVADAIDAYLATHKE